MHNYELELTVFESCKNNGISIAEFRSLYEKRFEVCSIIEAFYRLSDDRLLQELWTGKYRLSDSLEPMDFDYTINDLVQYIQYYGPVHPAQPVNYGISQQTIDEAIMQNIVELTPDFNLAICNEDIQVMSA